WNASIDGYGNHDPDKHRYTGLRLRWDFMRLGRGWAPHLRERDERVDELIRYSIQYLTYLPPCLAQNFIEDEGDSSANDNRRHLPQTMITPTLTNTLLK
ncbi:Eco29kI family restriction endonuclease, partial [Escherichia coli]|uniref:Eco29kI family restriction endonuclease n=1 Tax=Escherichia coli TaxID=562 RepID=UPI0011155441